MATPQGIATAISFLVSIYGRGKLPSDEDVLAEAWLALLVDVDDAALVSACHGHARASAWWPAPSEIIAASKPPQRDHAETWEAILARIARGRYELADLLDSTEARALASIGGSWEIRMADTDSKLPRLRKRFLAACKGDPVAHRAVEARESFRSLPGGRDGGR